MQSQTTDHIGPGAAKISSQYKTAEAAENNYVTEAIICGQMMQEQISKILSGHDVRCKKSGRFTPEDEQLKTWLANNCPEIDERKARRWRAAATRAIAIITESHASDPVAWLDFSGYKFFVSTVLALPQEDFLAHPALPEILTFRETFRRFLSDKTLAEVSRCALNGCDAAHNIDRASNGKNKGGTRGEDRRDYAKFLTVHFKEMNHLINRWDKFIDEDPSQHAKMVESLRNVILGGKIKLQEKGRPIDMPGWPKSFASLMRDLLKERLKGNPEE